MQDQKIREGVERSMQMNSTALDPQIVAAVETFLATKRLQVSIVPWGIFALLFIGIVLLCLVVLWHRKVDYDDDNDNGTPVFAAGLAAFCLLAFGIIGFFVEGIDYFRWQDDHNGYAVMELLKVLRR